MRASCFVVSVLIVVWWAGICGGVCCAGKSCLVTSQAQELIQNVGHEMSGYRSMHWPVLTSKTMSEKKAATAMAIWAAAARSVAYC